MPSRSFLYILLQEYSPPQIIKVEYRISSCNHDDSVKCGHRKLAQTVVTC